VQPLDPADRIEAYLRTQFDVSPDDTGFTRTGDLYELGYIDSVGVAELLEFLHEEFGVEIPEMDLLSEEFSSIDGMARIVRRLAGGTAASPGASSSAASYANRSR
jgi:acyl carrier protein